MQSDIAVPEEAFIWADGWAVFTDVDEFTARSKEILLQAPSKEPKLGGET